MDYVFGVGVDVGDDVFVGFEFGVVEKRGVEFGVELASQLKSVSKYNSCSSGEYISSSWM